MLVHYLSQCGAVALFCIVTVYDMIGSCDFDHLGFLTRSY